MDAYLPVSITTIMFLFILKKNAYIKPRNLPNGGVHLLPRTTNILRFFFFKPLDINFRQFPNGLLERSSNETTLVLTLKLTRNDTSDSFFLGRTRWKGTRGAQAESCLTEATLNGDASGDRFVQGRSDNCTQQKGNGGKVIAWVTSYSFPFFFF
jgi:hypothetical protein